MRKIYFLIILITGTINAQSVFINEIHYDNTGTDINEAIEIAGQAGTDLSIYTLVLYNGNGGGVYGTQSLQGIIPDEQNGFGTLNFEIAPLQNGPDAIALVEGNTVIQFLSYEGSFEATAGIAQGLTSTDIGVSESGSTPLDESLQLSGTGNTYADFIWQSSTAATPGNVNNGQIFSDVVLSNQKLEALKNETVLYPNPSTNGLVFLETILNQEIEVIIYNNIGVKLSTQLVSNNETISMEKLTPGLYFIQLMFKGSTVTKRVVIQ